MAAAWLVNKRLVDPRRISYLVNFILTLLVFFLVSGEVVGSIVSFQVDSLIDSSRIFQSYIVGDIVDGPVSSQYQASALFGGLRLLGHGYLLLGSCQQTF